MPYHGSAPGSFAYEWAVDGQPVYVGHGTTAPDGTPPWQSRWHAARDSDDQSPLSAWLRSHDRCPAPDWSYLPCVELPASAAAQLAAMRRKQLTGLLRSRAYSGSRPIVPIRAVLPSGEVRLYRSIRSCGRDLGVTRMAVIRQIARNMPLLTVFGVVRVSKV